MNNPEGKKKQRHYLFIVLKVLDARRFIQAGDFCLNLREKELPDL